MEKNPEKPVREKFTRKMGTNVLSYPVEVKPMEEQEKKRPEENGYVPRPVWQVWAARAGLIIVLILVAVQILTIAGGGG